MKKLEFRQTPANLLDNIHQFAANLWFAPATEF
jgi:hypothetical protein